MGKLTQAGLLGLHQMTTIVRHFLVLTAAALIFCAQTTAPLAKDAPLFQLETGGHTAMIRSVTFTSDGQYLISAGDDKVVRIWDWRRAKTIQTIRGQIGEGHAGKLFTVAISPDSRFLATAGWIDHPDDAAACCGAIRLYDFRSGRLLRILAMHKGTVTSSAFSPDGKMLVTGSTDKSAIVWEIASGVPRATLDKHTDRINAVVFAGAGQYIVSAGHDRVLRVWSSRDFQLISRSAALEGPIVALAASPTDDIVATGTPNGEIRLWRASTAEPLRLLAKQHGQVGSLSFTSDGKLLLATCTDSCTGENVQRVWNVREGTPVATYKGHDNSVAAAAICPDGSCAATAGGNSHEIHVWNLQTGEVRHRLRGVGTTVWAVAISKDGKDIAWGNTDPCPTERSCPRMLGDLQWQLRLPSIESELGRPKAFSRKPVDLSRGIHRVGQYSLEHARGGTETLPDAILKLKKGERVVRSVIRTRSDGLRHAAYTFTPNRSFFFSGGAHGPVTAYYGDDGQDAGDLIGHSNQIWAMAPSADGSILVTGSLDMTVRLWNVQADTAGNLKSGELIASLFHALDGEWIIWTPQGYYASSPNGDQYIGWHINQGPRENARFVTAGQIKKHFYRPDIVESALVLKSARNAISRARRTKFSLDNLIGQQPPSFEIISPEHGAEVGPDPLAIAIRMDAN
jgi:WD40 repeat protein